MKFSKKENDLLRKIGIDEAVINNPDKNDFSDLEDKVGDYLTLQCLDEEYTPNEEGRICEKILNKLS